MGRHKKMIMLLTAVCLLFAGCRTGEKESRERRADYVPDDSLIVREHYEGAGGESQLLSGMEPALDNDYLSLYTGPHYEIGVLNKQTGRVYLSNPVYADKGKEEQDALLTETKRLLFSQVAVEYFDSKQKQLSMSSWPDAVSQDKDQVTKRIENGVLTVTYGIGTNSEENGLLQAFTGETYEYYDQIMNDMVSRKELSIIEYRSFVNNYTKVAYEELSASERAEYLEKFPKLPELGTIYIIKPNLTNRKMNELLEMYTKLGINDELVKAEEEKMGSVAGLSSAYFEIPVSYRLHGADLLVSVDTADIKVSEGYYLTRISLLRSFGASRADQEGHILLPDGSGAVIENRITAASMDKVSMPFYGPDFGKRYASAQEVPINSSFPVFGIKAEEKAVFAVVENGAAIGGVSAQTVSGYLDYNLVYPYLNYTIYDAFDREGVAYAFSEDVPDVEYAVRYHFLEGEDNGYSAMARYYRTYLEQKGVLSKREDMDSLPLDINLIGSIDKTVNYMGIPVDKKCKATDFEEGYSIMKRLKDAGIGNADAVYSGIINGGLNDKAPSKVRFQKELGGKSGFEDLTKELSEIGYGLYTEVNFTAVHEKGNGITAQDDVAKALNRNTALMRVYNPAGGSDRRNSAYLVNPLKFGWMAKGFLKEYPADVGSALYVSGLGGYLNSNFSTKSGVTRQTALSLYEELLAALGGTGLRMKLDEGNEYALPYADSLINVASSSSRQRIESYSVPFVGMVLKGYLPYTTTAVNQSGNVERAVLEAVENGAGLHYQLMYLNQLELVDTEYKDLFSVNYEIWMDEIIETYQSMNERLGYLASVPIQAHERVNQDVARVLYEDGSAVYVNYGDSEYRTGDGAAVGALSWVVVPAKGGVEE